MTHGHLSKKEKKKLLNKKNRYHQQLYELLRLRRAEEDRVEELEESRSKPKRSRDSKKKKSQDDQVWSEKVATIRNRLDGKKRDSKERWNRFAGTGDAGARGL